MNKKIIYLVSILSIVIPSLTISCVKKDDNNSHGIKINLPPNFSYFPLFALAKYGTIKDQINDDLIRYYNQNPKIDSPAISSLGNGIAMTAKTSGKNNDVSNQMPESNAVYLVNIISDNNKYYNDMDTSYSIIAY